MPYRVEDVRFIIEPFRLTSCGPEASLGVRRSGFAGSAGVGASDDSGVRLNGFRGRGRRIRGSSDMTDRQRINNRLTRGSEVGRKDTKKKKKGWGNSKNRSVKEEKRKVVLFF